MKQHSAIHESLPMLASWYAGKFGVPIILDSSIQTEHTNGKSVHVPFVNLNKLKEEGKSPSEINQIKNAIFGWTAHGCMHVRFTDFSVLKHHKLTRQQFDMVNIIEDCRIERECIKLFPGSSETLNALAEYMLAKGLYATDADTTSVSASVLNFSLYYLQSNFVEQKCLANLANKFEVKLWHQFNMPFVIRLKALLGTVTNLKSTEEVIQLVMDIFKWIEEEAQNLSMQTDSASCSGKKDQSTEQSSGKDSSEPDSSDDSIGSASTSSGNIPGEGHQDQSTEQSSGKDSSESDSSDDSIGSASTSSGNIPGEDHQDQSTEQSSGKDSSSVSNNSAELDSSDDSKTGSASALSNADQLQNLKDLLDSSKGSGYEEAADKMAQLFNELVKQTYDSNMNFEFYSSAEKADNYGNGGFHNSVEEAKSASTRIRQKMLGLVQAHQRKETLLSRSGKRFDVARLHSIANGNTKIFKKEIEHRMPNTSVQLLVDLSASMNHISVQYGCKTNAMIAQETALALALALKPIAGVKTNVTYFSGTLGRNPLTDVLTSEQNVNHKFHNFFSRGPTGSTPLTEGLWFSANRLLKQKEDRKILFVITDGEPDDMSSAKHIKDLISKTDIKTIGIGINTSAVKQLFNESFVINDISELQNSLFDSMRNALLS